MSSATSEDPAQKLFHAITECLAQTGPREHSIRTLADYLRVSHPTLERWSRGKNLPHRVIAEDFLEIVRDFSHFRHLLAMIQMSYPLDWQRRIARPLGISLPTVERWFAGENFPHPAMMDVIIKEMEALLPHPETE